jgi:selenoprotein W-related protein
MNASRFVVSLLCALLVLPAGVPALGASDGSRPREGDVVVEIRHCNTCGYRGRAEQLAAEIKKELGYDSTFVEGKIGTFEVLIDGTLLFSKKDAGRFPAPGEIVKLINDHLDKEGGEGK